MEEKMGEKIEKIEKIDKVGAQLHVEATTGEQEIEALASKSKFDAAIAKAELNWDKAQTAKIEPIAKEAVTRPSLIEEISFSEKKIQRLEPASIEQITAQAEDLRGALKQPIAQLDGALKENPNTKISPVYEAQLSQRLVHIDSSLRSAIGKVGGVEVVSSQVSGPNTNPLVKFVNYLTTSDHKLQSLIGEVRSLDLSKQRLTPEKLLAVQIKLNFVQQELEFFTNILNKSLEAIKTTMNVQI